MQDAKSYVISVTLETGVYRHIQISAMFSLLDLSCVILCAFDFDDDHAHAFFMDNIAWGDGDAYFLDLEDEEDEEDEEVRFTVDYTLAEVIKGKGHRFKYVFDFGDNWQFQCRVLRELAEDTKDPIIRRSVGDAPPQYGEPGEWEE